jgi:pilus assembly protein CpaE
MARTPECVVIDPDPGSRADSKRALTLAHFTVVGEAGYGIEAVTVANENTPDIFLISVEEPVARALETMEALGDAVPDVPILAYSALADAASVRRAMVAGARDYLIRPLRPEDLSRAIDGVMEHEEKRRLRSSSGERRETVAHGTIITIFGAKGGIGKTTISTNLATALVRGTGSTVTLVDMDTRFGDVAIMMDVAVEQSIADLARHVDEMDRDTVRDYLVRHHSGVMILPAPLHPTEWRNVTPAQITKIIDLLAQTYDYVVVDTPGTFNEIVAATLEAASIILLVTSMDIASIKDTALALEMLQSASVSEDKVKLMINHSTAANTLREEDVERVLEYKVFWRIPHDLNVATSTQLGQPVIITKPFARVSCSIIDLASALSGTTPEKRGFLEKFLGR